MDITLNHLIGDTQKEFMYIQAELTSSQHITMVLHIIIMDIDITDITIENIQITNQILIKVTIY